jgi:UDP-N-acetylmuramoyl-tripeptide--D-alanyl-D-alanine ligase
VAYPLVIANAIAVPLLLGRLVVTVPTQHKLVKASEKYFRDNEAIRIAVAGSYGKTTMKELLLTVLSEGKKVAATPANKNVAVSHAMFAAGLRSNEEVLIIEYGEGKPGDVARFARTTHPTHGIITGLAPAHLDRYKTLQAAGKDIFSLASYLHDEHVYVNGESNAVEPFIKSTHKQYNAKGALGWKAKDIELTPTSTSFTLSKGKRELHLTSGLLGKHQVGPLSLVAALALELGLTEQQVTEGVAKTVPFEHRMQPYQLAGAWIIDDTYNGNLEGVRAGTALLAAVEARRKFYVTPGLVDQGSDSNKIHVEMGELIAAAKPNIVVLMENSALASIQKGLKRGKFAGEVRIESDPLAFYSSLDQFVAAGDVVLMQNDWTDNYA